jgi:hypothetical protein
MTKESMIKVLRYKAEHIKTRIKPEFFTEVADSLEQQLCEDAISCKELLSAFSDDDEPTVTKCCLRLTINHMPSVQPKYNANEWCNDCSEYDHNKHCCPRYNKVIRKAVEEIKRAKVGHWIGIYDGYADGNPVYDSWECSECGAEFIQDEIDFDYCPYCGAKMVEPQAESEE